MTKRDKPRNKKLRFNEDHPRPLLGSPITKLPRTIDKPVPDLVRATDLEHWSHERVYLMGMCTVRLAREPDGYKLSISHKDRYPTWDEVTEAKYRLIPNVMMAMPLPEPDEYLNLHPYTFNLFEIRKITND